MIRLFHGFIALSAALPVYALAEVSAPADHASAYIKVTGRADTTVTQPVVHLADIAEVQSPRVQDDETVIQLKKIAISKSPKAGEKLTIFGSEVLDKLKDEGVRLDRILYTLPREITVNRAFREVTMAEIERAVVSFIDQAGENVSLKKVDLAQPIKVPASVDSIKAISMDPPQNGQAGIEFKAGDDDDTVRFQLRALVDEWKLVPVANRPLKKGSMINGDDVQLARINTAMAGRDVLEGISDVVGHAAAQDVGQGEAFRRNSVLVPPVITAGSKVSLIYRSGLLEATATGIALDSGPEGAEIQVRNEDSKRIVRGVVQGEGMVIVGGAK